jgi:hypothetical protein
LHICERTGLKQKFMPISLPLETNFMRTLITDQKGLKKVT